MLSHCLSILAFILVLLSEDGDCFVENMAFSRKVSLLYNPGCNFTVCSPTSNSSVNLIYARSKGENDSLHYILSTVGSSAPTLLLLRSNDADAILDVDWNKFLNSQLHNITGSVRLVSTDNGLETKSNIENVVIFDKLLEYNDSSDEADIDSNKQFLPILLRQLEWNVNINDSAESTLYGTTSEHPKSFSQSSNISLSFAPFETDGRSTELPSLPHNANSSEWVINLNSLLSRGNGSRFGIEMLLLASESNVSRTKIKSINDEYAPSIFTMEKLEWMQESIEGTNTETFSQWRAVSYTAIDHQRKYSTDVKTTNFKAVNKTSSPYTEDVLENRLLRAYYALGKLKSMSATSIEVSFGQPEDGFYSETKFVSWTSTIGFGSAPVDGFSTMIICMLFAGVGCPLLVIITGGVYVTYLRVKRSHKLNFKTQLVTNYDYQAIE